MHRQRYSKGHFCIREGLASAPELERFIRELRFLDVDDSTRIRTPSQRKRHRLYYFHFPSLDVPCVLKVDQVDSGYSWLRRQELRLTGLLRDNARRSYEGALALEQAGLETMRPLAHWTYRVSRFYREGYFLYQAIETDLGIKRYRDSIADAPSPKQLENFNQLIEMMARLTRRMHDAGLRHGDIVTGNFLVAGHERDKAGELLITDATRVYLIDTDHIKKARIALSPIKHFFDLYCLRRLDFDDEGVRFFLRRYYDRPDVNISRSLRFWERGGFRLSFWLKGRRKKSYSNLDPREQKNEVEVP